MAWVHCYSILLFIHSCMGPGINIHPQIIGLGFLYLLIQVGRKIGLFLPELANNYLTDILCMPILLSLTLMILRLVKKNNQLWFDAYKISFALLYVSFVFEWWLPKSSTQYTSDFIDVLCYAVGSLVFYFYQYKWFPNKQIQIIVR